MVDENEIKTENEKTEGKSFAYDEDSSPADISNGFYFRQLQENSSESH